LFSEEGREQIARFGERHRGVRRLPLPAAQLLPTPGVITGEVASGFAWDGSPLPTLHDGFFYALLEKTE
jgi:16S rRNA C967 or C1407 C5-methylase (RsmB/RsmF family)